MQALEQAEIFLRTLSDPLPAQGLEALFLFGQTVDNQESTFDAAEHLYRRCPGLQILMLAGGPRSGYPGFDPWQRALTARGIAGNDIHPLPPADSPLLHTRIEALALIRHLQEKPYRRVGVVAAPFHQVRAFMTAISVALESACRARIYSFPGTAQPWLEAASHSQGALNGSRLDLIDQELQRIDTYQKTGDLAGTRAILAYLEERDTHG